MTRSIAEIRAELEAAQKLEADKLKEAMKLTPIKWRYTVTPNDDRHWTEIFDDTCVNYKISGECVNEAEAKAAGHPEYSMRSGSMNYIFNKATGKIVCSTGGGMVFISNPLGWRPTESDVVDPAAVAMKLVSDFIVAHPDGGDITHIIEQHQRDKHWRL